MSTTSEPTPLPESTGAGAQVATAPPPWPRMATRRRLWLLFTIAWTVALQVPVPFRDTGIPHLDESLFTFSKSLHVAAYAVFTGLSAWMLLPFRYRWLLPFFLIG